jgi:hypothetical protein
MSIIKKLFALILFSLLISQLFSQPLKYPDIRINIFWDFYSNNRLSTVNAGRGYTGIAGNNDISGVVLNPASLSVDKKFQIHGEYVYKTDVPWLQSIMPTGVNLKQLHPAFMVSGAYKFNDLISGGLLFYTSNTQKLSSDLILTNEFGQQIGTYTSNENTSISSLAVPIVVNYKNKFKAGINVSVSFYHGDANYTSSSSGSADGKANFTKFNAQFGLIVFPIKDLSIGATFSPQVKQNIVWEFPGIQNDTFTSNVFPMKLGAGAEYRFRGFPLKLAFDYTYINSSKQQGLKDRNDFYFGAEYDLLKNISVRTGFFTLRDYRNGSNYIDPIGKYDEYFLTIGGTYRVKKMAFSAALMDSHLLSTGLIKQTIINGGLTMDF